MVIVGQDGEDPQGLQTLDCISHDHRLQKGRGGGQVSGHRFWVGGSRSRLDLGQQPWFTLYVVIVGQAGKDPQGMHTLDSSDMVIGSRKAVGEARLVATGSGMAGAGVDWISGKNPGSLCISKSNVFGKNLMKIFIGVGWRRAVG